MVQSLNFENNFRSVCYYFSTLQSVFTGDTIFCAGAGRFFEGNGEMMVKAFDAIFQLPDETLLFPGHDYNLSNLKFAKKLEPNNNEINLMLEKFENLDSVSKLATSLGIYNFLKLSFYKD